MSQSPPAAPDAACHELLLRLAGRLLDQPLAQARRQFADGATRSALAAVLDLAVTGNLALTAGELATLRELTGDPAGLAGIAPADGLPELPFEFSQAGPDGDTGRDELDDAVIAAAEARDGEVTGVWRAWRYLLASVNEPDQPPAADATEDPGEEVWVMGPPEDPAELGWVHRVYVVQVEQAAFIPGTVGDLYQAIGQRNDASVEVILVDSDPPPYQRAALDEAMMLWAVPAGDEFVVARVFDFADPATGPGFDSGHEVVTDEAARDRLLSYLQAGAPVLLSTAVMHDILDPAAGQVVPMSFRTDGEWIWTDTVEYYLRTHNLAPDPKLTAHIEAKIADGQDLPQTDEETALRAADFVLNPAKPKNPGKVWIHDSGAAS